MTTKQRIITSAFVIATTFAGGFCFAEEGNYLTCQSTTVDQSEHKTVTIGLKNTTTFSAFQCDITLPETVTFVGNDGKYISGTERLSSTHKIIEKMIADNHLRVLVYSTDNSPFSNDSEGLFSYTIEAVNPSEDSTSKTDITDVIFSEVNEEGEEVDCIEHKLSDLAVNTQVTGIGGVTVSEMKIYVSGKHLIVLSPKDTIVHMTTIAGVVTPIEVRAGKNIITIDNPGVYIVNDTKVVIQ